MRYDEQIQRTWLVMLKECPSSAGPLVRPLGEGYYAVVLQQSIPPEKTSSINTDFEQVKPYITDLDRTRAVYLDRPFGTAVPNVPKLESWAGPAAAEVEKGHIRAFAVVAVDQFIQHVVRTLSANGWELEQQDQSLLVSDGQFVERANLLKVLVRMVLSRSTIATAAAAVVHEIKAQFSELDKLFLEFQSRFRNYAPAVLNHYFVAYPAMSSVGAGWDYWEVADQSHTNIRQVFGGAMSEMEEVLRTLEANWVSTSRHCLHSSGGLGPCLKAGQA
jgi:hypothetical protein